MRSKLQYSKIVSLLLLSAIAIVVSGCANPDSDRLSDRPWNAPKNWEHGVPLGIMEGR